MQDPLQQAKQKQQKQQEKERKKRAEIAKKLIEIKDTEGWEVLSEVLEQIEQNSKKLTFTEIYHAKSKESSEVVAYNAGYQEAIKEFKNHINTLLKEFNEYKDEQENN